MTLEVERYKNLLQEMGDVRSMVYREHVRLRADWRAEEAALRSKVKLACLTKLEIFPLEMQCCP